MNKRWALPQVDEARCTLCGLCVEACPCHAVKLGERGPVFTCPEVCLSLLTRTEAFDCLCVCEEVCPSGAIACAFEIVLGADRGGSSAIAL